MDGHLTHGAKPTFSGKNYKAIQYDVNPITYYIDYDNIQEMLFENHPRLLIAGASAYPREIDFKKISNMIDDYNTRLLLSLKSNYKDEEKAEEEFENKKCYFMVDMAHIAGLVAADLHQSPLPYADVVTSTTHKTLRGPRGGIILTNNKEIATKIDKAVFPRMSRWTS